MDKKLAEGTFLKNVELVIVSDGSKDATMEQIIGYSVKYPTSGKLSVRGVNQVQN